MTDTILYSRAGHVGRLILNNPEEHNALGNQQLQALEERLDQVASDSAVRVLLISGAGERTFCSGASLKELGGSDITAHAFQRVSAQVATLSVPTICMLNGSVFGGGVELAVSCDFRIGVEGMRMRVPAARLGLCYPPDGIQRFIDTLGRRVTRRILVAAEGFDAQGLKDIGFLDHLALRQNLESSAGEMAQRIAGLAPLAVQSMKEVLRQAAGGIVDTEDAERLARKCAGSEDLQEGLAAQREKRTPRFRGC
tara:strand:+ start:68862 stop:69620 length:759 start_codon:yes stop_codon:yes gene_type:complete